MSIAPFQKETQSVKSSLKSFLTSNKSRTANKILLWLRIPSVVQWLLGNTPHDMQVAEGRDSETHSSSQYFRTVAIILMRSALKNRRRILFIVIMLILSILLYKIVLGIYISHVSIVIPLQSISSSSSSSDEAPQIVQYAAPNGPPFSSFILYMLGKLSGVPMISEPVDSRAALTDNYMDIYSSQNKPGDYIALSCVSPALKLRQYILATGFWEQLQNGVLNVINLIELGHDMDRLTVFPQVSNSRLFGIPNLGVSSVLHGATTPLDLYYNTAEINQYLCRVTGVMMDSFSGFLERSPREIIIAHYIHSKHTKDEFLPPPDTLLDINRQLTGKSHIDCSHILMEYIGNKILNAINSQYYYSFRGEFRISHILCINGSHVLHVLEFLQLFSSLTYEPNSIIINNWRGLPRETSTDKPEDINTTKRIRILLNTHFPQLEPWPFSQKVDKLFRSYISALNVTRPLVGLHFRLEKLAMAAQSRPVPEQYIAECIQEVKSHLMQLRQSIPEANSYLAICDIGQYASDTCQGCNGGNTALEQVLKAGIKFTFYHPTQDGLEDIPDSGLVSLVEMSALLEAQFLVLVGGGGYQKQLMSRFRNKLGINNHNTNNTDYRIIQLCS